MKSYFLVLTFFLFVACGEINQVESYENLNSTFALTDLSGLSADEAALATELCSQLVNKETTFQNSYISKFFNYSSSIKECESDESTSKSVTLTLKSDLTFSATSDAEYAFLTPELSDNNSSFSKFCQGGLSSRYLSSSDNIYHFNISKKSDQYEVTILSSFYHEVVDGKKEYKIYKRENLFFAASSSATYPAGVVLDRTLATTSYCTNSSEEFIKTSTLNSIRD